MPKHYFNFTGRKHLCADCGKSFTSQANVRRHRNERCKYRERENVRVSSPRKRRAPVRDVVLSNEPVDLPVEEFFSVESTMERVAASLDGMVRDYDLVPDDAVGDVCGWLQKEKLMVEDLYNSLSDFALKGRMILCA